MSKKESEAIVTKSNQSERRDFTVDQNIISHLISHQAGSISKALMELAMNCVDAGAKRIDIEISDTHFSIKDDGMGFESKEDVIELFGRFGKPHTEDEDERRGTVYGRFRMGRGQIMAFSKCSWRSAAFKMEVDIHNKGLTYDLSSDEEFIQGCIVSGEFYEAQEDIKTDTIEKVLKYIDIDVFLNGNKISFDPSKEKWDYENELFYYRDDDKYSLAVYNQGVYVLNTSAWEVGSGGTLVSKKRMEVNFARNDILVNQCDVWKNFAVYIKEYALVKDRKKAKKSIPKHMRSYYFNETIKGNIPVKEFCSYKLLEDQNGKVHSIDSLYREYRYTHVAVAKHKGCTYSEHIAGIKNFFVFGTEERENFTERIKKEGMSAFFEGIRASALIRLLDNEIKEEYSGSHYPDSFYEFHYLKDIVEWIDRLHYVDNIMSLSKQYPQTYKLFKDKELDEVEKLYLTALRRANKTIHSHVLGWNRQRRGKYKERGSFPERRLLVGDSMGAAEAWTDGSSYVAIERRVLQEAVNRGHSVAGAIINLILHEYIHDTDNTVENIHGLEFYEDYHYLTHGYLFDYNGYLNQARNTLVDVAYNTSVAIAKSLAKGGHKLPTKTAKLISGVKKITVENALKELSLFEIPKYIKKEKFWKWDDKVKESFDELRDVEVLDKKHEDYSKIFNSVAQSISNNKNEYIKISLSVDISSGGLSEAFIRTGGGIIYLKTNKFPRINDSDTYTANYFNRLRYELSLLGIAEYGFTYVSGKEKKYLNDLLDHIKGFREQKEVIREDGEEEAAE